MASNSPPLASLEQSLSRSLELSPRCMEEKALRTVSTELQGFAEQFLDQRLSNAVTAPRCNL
jgi:hypothetical protein